MHDMFNSVTRRVILGGPFATTLLGQQSTNWQSALQKWRGVRPRLLLNAEKLSNLRSAITTTHRDLWQKSQEHLNILARRDPPPYTQLATGTDPQLYQRDNCDWMCQYATLYLLGGNRAHLDSCKRWALASCSYPFWATGQHENGNLAAAHQLFGLSIVYDWLQSELDTATKTTIRNTLLQRGAAMYSARTRLFWRNWTQSNHVDISLCGLLAAALALFDDPEGAVTTPWITYALGKLRECELTYPLDGANREGVGYFTYGSTFLLKFWQLASELLNEKPDDGYLKEAAWYLMYLTLPRGNRSFSAPIHVDLGDSPRTAWYGPDTILRRFASLYNIPQAQWYADDFAKTYSARYTTSWINHLWYDPKVVPKQPTAEPTLKTFQSLGIVSARSDWSGQESLVVFKCGAPFSNPARPALADEGEASHCHPDANHVTVFAEGEYLLRDDGYLAAKFTANHNTLLVGSKGQKAEGFSHFDGRLYLNLSGIPRIVSAVSSSSLDYMVGDATAAYSADQAVRKFVRHVVFLKPNVLIVIDDIELERSAALELRFHPESPTTRVSNSVFESRGATSLLRTEVLTDQGTEISIGQNPSINDNTGKPVQLTSIRLRRTGLAWRNVTSFSWGSREAPRVSMESSDAGFVFSVNGRRASFGWTTGAQELTTVPAIRFAQPVLPAFGGNPNTHYAPNGYLEIYGTNLASNSRTWEGKDFSGNTAPRSLDGTEVRINGKSAFVYFISANQINVNIPDENLEGPVSLQVIRNGVPSNLTTVELRRTAPALLTTSAFFIQQRQYVVALLPNSSQSGPFVGRPDLLPGVAFESVKPGDRIIFYVLGAGPTTPPVPAGTIAAANSRITSPFELRIGGQVATVEFFGIVQGTIGLYQINAIVPQVGPGDQPIELTVAGNPTRQNLFLSGIAAQ